VIMLNTDVYIFMPDPAARIIFENAGVLKIPQNYGIGVESDHSAPNQVKG
jgi:hypothetical protein